MTLIIAGYEYSKSLDYSLFLDEPTESHTPKMEIDGLFVVADSAITSHAGGRTLLNGFRKVHSIEAKLWKPYFMPDGSFRDYLEVYETRNLFIAFAGSTLTAQHIINSITEHLSNLRISYERENGDGEIKYNVIRHCQKNPLTSGSFPSYWDNDTFLSRDFQWLLTGEVIASTIEYSMNDALRSAGKYKLSLQEFNAMHTEIVAGVWCPASKRHELHVYRMLSKAGDDGVLVAYTSKALVPPDQIVVLGMRNTFEAAAQDAFSTAIKSLTPPGPIMYKFLEEAIDKVQKSGSKEIDRPTSYRNLNKHTVKRIR